MVRIGGGVFPDIKEKDFLGEGGYRVDNKAGKVHVISPSPGDIVPFQVVESIKQLQTSAQVSGGILGRQVVKTSCWAGTT